MDDPHTHPAMYSPQPSTSEVRDLDLDDEFKVDDDSDEVEDFEEVGNSAESTSPVNPAPKKKKKRERRPPDPTDPAVIAAAAQAYTDAAEAEEAEKELLKTANAMTNLENIKYYTSLFLGTLCIVNVFAFLFLVPFVLDPAISTLRHRFVDSPVTCMVQNVSVKHGKSQCLWSSCREGCTSDMYQCYQVRVAYADVKYKNNTFVNDFRTDDWADLTRFDALENQTMTDTPLLVNIKGCGYPPEISCPSFAYYYEELKRQNATFPCYYSRENPWIVLQTYDYRETIGSIVASILIPNVIFVVSIVILLFWYCPYCQARCKKYEDQIDQEEEVIKENVADPIASGTPTKRF